MGMEADITFIGAAIRLSEDFSTKVKEFIRLSKTAISTERK